MGEFLIEFILTVAAASIGCAFGVLVADVLIFRPRALRRRQEIDMRVQQILESDRVYSDDEVGKNLNIRM